MKHYLNGKIVSEDKLLVSPRDLGFLRAYCVFDFLRTYNGKKPLKLQDHVERLLYSAKGINLNHPWSKDSIISIVNELIDINKKELCELAIRIIISGGLSKSVLFSEKPSLIIIFDRAIDFDEEIYLNGINVITREHQRYLPKCKTTNYIESLSIYNSVNKDFGEVIFTKNNLILEGSFSNFFSVINGKILTPGENVLNGITRKIVIEELDLTPQPEKKNIYIKDIGIMSEVFITLSGKDIVPVVKIDNQIIGKGVVGDVTKKVIKKYKEYLHLV